MSSSLSKLVDNLSEGIHFNKCSYFESNLDYIKIKNEKLLLKCFNCNIYYKKKFNKDLIKKIKNTYCFCNSDFNKFILLLRKGVYPYEYVAQCGTLKWHADVFENFRDMCIKEYELDPAHFLSLPGLT